jgi:hypothetical protein
MKKLLSQVVRIENAPLCLVIVSENVRLIIYNLGSAVFVIWRCCMEEWKFIFYIFCIHFEYINNLINFVKYNPC